MQVIELIRDLAQRAPRLKGDLDVTPYCWYSFVKGPLSDLLIMMTLLNTYHYLYFSPFVDIFLKFRCCAMIPSFVIFRPRIQWDASKWWRLEKVQ